MKKGIRSSRWLLFRARALLISALVAAGFTWAQEGRPFAASFVPLLLVIELQIELFYWLGTRFFSSAPELMTGQAKTGRVIARLLQFYVVVLAIAALINWGFIALLSLAQGSEWSGLLHRIIRQDSAGFFASFAVGLLIGTAIFFYFMWQGALSRERKLREEKLIFQYETLKNQVNPHFLFNSLNTLASLVHQDADLAEQFIQKLSSIYRYVLENKDADFVPLEREMAFVRDYFYLQKIRDEEKIQLAIQLPAGDQASVLPISVQLLVENALKHNKASRDQPLRISITQEQDRVVVRNTLQKKATLESPSPRIGLKNLAERIRLTLGKELDVSETREEFIVKVPVKLISHESTDHRG